jgi:hypothetical protein
LLADIRDAFATDKATKARDMFGAEQIEISSADLGGDGQGPASR